MSHPWYPNQPGQMASGPYQQWSTPYGQQQQGGMWPGGGVQWQQGQSGPPSQSAFFTQQRMPLQYPPQAGFAPRGGFQPPSQQFAMNQQQLQQFQAMQQQRQQVYLQEQQKRQQAYLQEQQKRQQAYLQEQQRLAREEKKKRDFEIQKRLLKNVNVLNPASTKPVPSATSTNPLEDLFGKKPMPTTASTAVTAVPHVSSAAMPGPDAVLMPQTSASVQTPSVVESNITSAAKEPFSSEMSEDSVFTGRQVPEGLTKEVPSAASSKPKTAETYAKLMEESLSNLNKPSPPSVGKSDFKTPATPPRVPSLTKKSFTPSMKAHSWDADAGEFSGIFARRQPVEQEADAFGEFQSSAVQPSASLGLDSAGSNFPTQVPKLMNVPLPTQRPFTQAHVLLQQPGGVLDQNLSGMIPTSTYTQPITATHVSGPMLSNEMRARAISNPQVPDSFQLSGATGRGDGPLLSRPRGQTIHPTLPTGIQTLHNAGAQVPTAPSAPSHTFAGLDPSRFPPIYLKVHNKCVGSGEPFVNTELLYPILTSSQLPRSLLRDLWTVANRAVPGRLNQTELFVLLGLIGLAQAGNPSPTLEDLKKAPQPPVPKLAAFEEAMQMPSHAQEPSGGDDFGEFQAGAGGFPSSSIPTTRPSTTPLHPTPSTSSTLPQPVKLDIPVQPVQPELPPPLLPAGSTHVDNIYSAFEELRQVSGVAGMDSGPQLESSVSEQPPKDKYSVFKELVAPISNQPPSTQHPANVSVTASATVVPTALGSQPPIPAAVTSSGTSGSSLQGLTAFGDFTSAPPVAKPTLLQPLVPTNLVEVSAGNTSGKQAEDFFASFSGNLAAAKDGGGGGGGGWADFSSFSTAMAEPKTVMQPVPSTTAVTTSSSGSLQLELLAELSYPPSNTAVSNASTSALGQLELAATQPLSSLQFDPLAELAQPSSSNAVSSTAPSYIQPHMATKGLEILEEELEAKLSETSLDTEVATVREPSPLPLIPEPSDEDFGEFEAYSSPKARQFPAGEKLQQAPGAIATPWGFLSKSPESESPRIWQTCLSRCEEVLRASAGVFSQVEEGGILQEIASSEEGRNRLRGIVEVYRLAKRIHCSMKSRNCVSTVDSLAENIRSHWKTLVDILPNNIMEQLYAQTTPSITEPDENDVLSDTISKCSLCLMAKKIIIPAHLALDGRREEYSLLLLFHQGQSYHATCANFWSHAVQEELPTL